MERGPLLLLRRGWWRPRLRRSALDGATLPPIHLDDGTGEFEIFDVPPPRPEHPGRRWLVRALAVLTILFLVSQVVVSLQVRSTLRSPFRTTRFMEMDAELARRLPPGNQLRVQLEHPVHEWVTLDQVSQDALRVLVSREDQALVTRSGPFDPGDFVDRASAWLRGDGDRDPSGSTIPQQVAKNLFTDGGRHAVRKAVEADYASWLTILGSNREILLAYVNLIEFGPGVYGLCGASWYYFDKPPSRLTVQNTASLVGLMPSPKRFTIDPTAPTVKYARVHALRYLRFLARTPRAAQQELFSAPSTTGGRASCQSRPASLRARERFTAPHGFARFADDQSFWPRLTRQWSCRVLPPDVDVDVGRLRRLAPRTAGSCHYRR